MQIQLSSNSTSHDEAHLSTTRKWLATSREPCMKDSAKEPSKASLEHP